MPEEKDKILEIHGIKFTRTGECNRCPGVHPAPCCIDCSHFKVVDGINTCLIYDKRHEVCKECSDAKSVEGEKKEVTHQVCIDFPNHPFLWVINENKCAYKFEPLTQEDADKLSELEIRYKKYGDSS